MMMITALLGSFMMLRSQLSTELRRTCCVRADTIDEIAAASIDASEREMISKIAGPKGAGYGEMLPQGMDKLAEFTSLGYSDAFFDVGSGTGKLVLQAAAVHGAAVATGVELSPTRHALAVQALERLAQSEAEAAARVRLVLGDAVESEDALAAMRAATVIYANNLLFGAALQERLAQRLREAKAARFVVVTKAFVGPIVGFVLDEEPLPCAMSWQAPIERGAPMPPGFPCAVYRRRQPGRGRYERS